MSDANKNLKAYLVLENGAIFAGELRGKIQDASGEVVFCTHMLGHFGMLTSKSVYGKILVCTFPSIGNVGAILQDCEGTRAYPSAIVCKELCDNPSNFRLDSKLEEYLKDSNVTVLCGIDTRMLTKMIRENGEMQGIICTDARKVDLSKLASQPTKSSIELCNFAPYTSKAQHATHHLALIDYGHKNSTLAFLNEQGFDVTVLPCTATKQDVSSLNVHGIVLSEGVGNPHSCEQAVQNLRGIIGLNIPIFALSFGHLMLARACGINTKKMHFGHRGSQAVRDLNNNKILITSQMHGYEIDKSTLGDIAHETFANINDLSNEGLKYTKIRAQSVAFEPKEQSLVVLQEFLRSLK